MKALVAMPPLKLIVIALLITVKIHSIDAQAARKENIRYLRCAVCEQLSKHLFEKVSEKQALKKKLSEFEIIELAENICNLKKRESEWIFFIDIVREGDKLKLVQQPEEGECQTKCKTIERTCQEVIGDHDTDIAEFIHKRIKDLSEEAIFNALCNKMSRSCSSKIPSLPKTLDLGEPFMPKSSKDADMARLMRSMADMPGAPGMQMYSKDDLMGLNNLGAENQEDDDDDDTDDRSKLQSLLKKQKLKNLVTKPAKRTMLSQATDHIRSIGREAWSGARNTYNKFTRYLKRWRRTKSAKRRPAHKEL